MISRCFSSRSVCSLSDVSLFLVHDVLGWFASHDALIVCSLVDAQKLLVLRSLTMHVVLCSSSSCRPRPMSLVDVGSSLKSPCFRMAKVVIIPAGCSRMMSSFVDVSSCFLKRCCPRCFCLALGAFVQSGKVGVLPLYLVVVLLSYISCRNRLWPYSWFLVQSDEATGVVPFVVFILVWRMPFGLAQSWFARSAEVVAVALEPCSSPSFGNWPAKKEEKKLWNLIPVFW